MEDKEQADASPRNKVHPIKRSNILSKLFFWWAFPIFSKGFKKTLTEDDLYGPLKKHESKRLGDKLERAWLLESRKLKPSLWKVIIKVFGLEFAAYGFVLFFLECILKMFQPLLLAMLMDYYVPNQTEISKEQAYVYASLIAAVSFFNIIISHSYTLGLQHLGMRIRVACCSLVYRKSLKLSKSAFAETTVGQMVNILSNDVNRFDLALIHLHNLWVAPVETVVIVYLLYKNVGVTSLAGVAILLVFVPVQLTMGKLSSKYRMRTALKTDQRVRLMNEIISGIQVIKMYTWEIPFTKLVEKARKLEIHQIRAASYLRALNVSFMMFLNRASVFLCILTYILTGNSLNAQYVYVVVSYYGVLRQAVTIFLPHGVTTLAETNISVHRIQKFLSYDEIDPNRSSPTDKNSNQGIHMENACVKWVDSTPDYTLKNINLDCNPGELVAVVGTVGAGKTTLLHIILKELELKEGSIDVNGSISYASQEPWLFVGSIRQNILFGQDMDEKKYYQVIKACALQRDFDIFPYGDQTIVGERGVMLSGGQKARINLARAVYKDSDIYLLDDPLSAVDTHVGKQLFDDCISGYLKDKCVILVTHQLQYLKDANRIYYMSNGAVAASGTYSDLQQNGGDLMKLLEKEDEEDDEMDPIKKAKSLKKIVDDDKPVGKPTEVKEIRGSGTINKRIYSSYLRAGGNWCVTSLIFSMFFMTQIGGSGTDFFLNFWVNLEQDRAANRLVQPDYNVSETESSTGMMDVANGNFTDFHEESFVQQFFTPYTCMYIHSAMICYIIIMAVTRSMSFFTYAMRASRILHNKMFSKIVYASMYFFNNNPSGRILNRFAKDIGSVDEVLPVTITDTIQVMLNVFTITLVISSVNLWILIPSGVLFVLFYGYRMVFLSTSRNLKRIEGTTRSPVFSHLTASLQGMTTIRAFGAEDILRLEFDHHQDLHSSAFFLFIGCNRAFGFWLDMNCVVYIALVTLSFLFMGDEMYGGNVGLAITQSMNMTGMLQYGMRQWSELENQMTSVERVVEYTELDQEPDKGRKMPARSWPDEGEVEFQSVSMRYSENEPFVLKNLSFSIKSQEKVGVVGRTGAGKSSLISALFRLAQIEGKILIDNVDSQQIPLQNLRSKISIIPQEPVLFSGTLRKNLDPFEEYDDEKIWDALNEVELKGAISDIPSGLHSTVNEGGSNFSVGQRQLLCLARAVIRSNKVLIMDEATANVDPHTDELIQQTIRRKFIDCTVLTIAHRLHTIIDSDKVLVMDEGSAVEFDHPYILLQKKGVFHGLVAQTGKNMADNLEEIARNNYEARHNMP